jgi:hypothetical protein
MFGFRLARPCENSRKSGCVAGSEQWSADARIHCKLIIVPERSEKQRMAGSSANPRAVLLFSGKRKSGKDYLTDRLQVFAVFSY